MLTTARLNLLLQPDRGEDPPEETVDEDTEDDESATGTDDEAGDHAGAEEDQVEDARPARSRPGPASPPPLALYTPAEWRSIAVVLSTLPPTVSSLTISVEFPHDLACRTTEDIHTHLTDVPDWAALTVALQRFPNLEAFSWLRRVNTRGIITDEELDASSKKIVKRKLKGVQNVCRVLNFRR